MTLQTRLPSTADHIFNKYKKVEVTKVDENNKQYLEKLGSDDNAVEAEEYRYALDDLYSTFFENKSDAEYTRWMEQCGNIDAPITDANKFFTMLSDAFTKLQNISDALHRKRQPKEMNN